MSFIHTPFTSMHKKIVQRFQPIMKKGRIFSQSRNSNIPYCSSIVESVLINHRLTNEHGFLPRNKGVNRMRYRPSPFGHYDP